MIAGFLFNFLEISAMQLIDLLKTDRPSDAEIQQQIHYQMLVIFKSFFSMLEEGWEKPLTQWQAELNIQPIQSR
jgi:hypothetical protein